MTVPYRTNPTVDLERIAREAPLGGRERQRRARLGVVLGAVSILTVVGWLVPAPRRQASPQRYEAARVEVTPLASALPSATAPRARGASA